MSHQFSQIPSVNLQRSTFNRSHGYKTTFNEGDLVPFFVDEVLPGDTFNLKASIFARMATPVVPFMDNVFLETFFFFVPNRLVWTHWQQFNGEQKSPGDRTDYLIPIAKATNAQNGTLWDYFGLPTNINKELKVNALPFRAYRLIWNEWFRDENLQDGLPSLDGDEDMQVSVNKPFKRGKRHDYFTSCLPWPQKGDSVDIPLSADLRVKDGSFSNGYINTISYNQGGVKTATLESLTPTSPISDRYLGFTPGTTAVSDTKLIINKDALTELVKNIEINNATNSPVTINSLREAIQIQRMLERDARGGTRYTEILRAHFGVISPDARLQRPEYLGGSSTRLVVKPVEQTSQTSDVTPQGNLAAYGVFGDSFHGFTKSFTEHGYIIGLVNVRADLTYQQGINRMWSRQTRFDFYWPTLAHLGEQPVYNKEIYAQGTEEDDKVFGYQERYAEYRYYPSLITGKFRSTDPQTLDIWHLSQKFDNLPKLNSTFIQDNPPIERVVAVTDEPHFIMDCYFNLKCTRPMPLYGVPGLMDHF